MSKIYKKFNLLRFIGKGKDIDIKYYIEQFQLPLVMTNDLATQLLENEYYHLLSEEDKNEFIQRKEDISVLNQNIKPLNEDTIINMPVNSKSRSIILQKFNEFEKMRPNDPHDYPKMKQWLAQLSQVPFGKYADLPVTNISLQEDKTNYLTFVQNTLDDSIYGQQHAKDKLLQIVAQWIVNPESVGNCIALYGPPGVGKTSLIKEGLSKALNRSFNFISLGGAQDSNILKGHSFTYIGSKCGKMVECLVHSKCMNPIFFFDELDKIGQGPKGQEISQVLTSITDVTQNNEFQDIYFNGIDFDISKALFIFSYNFDEMIDPLLKDRMIRIKMDEFKINDKVEIAKNYLLPKLCMNYVISFNDIVISDDVIRGIVHKFTDEKGVRRLLECLDTIYAKINLLKHGDVKKLKITYNIPHLQFPVEITSDIAFKLLRSNRDDIPDIVKAMYL